MNYDKISSNLIFTGVIFLSCSILKKIKDNNSSKCINTTSTLGTTLIVSGSALNIINSLRN